MMTLKEIRDALQDRIPGKVADACGVHYNTVRRIRDDPNANPTHAVVVALSEYLERGRVVRVDILPALKDGDSQPGG